MSAQRMGLGENIVQDTVDQDEYQVFKPVVSDDYFVSIIDVSAATKPSLSTATGQTPTSKAERVALVLSSPKTPKTLDGPAPLTPITSALWTWPGVKDSLASDSFIPQARPEAMHLCRDATADLKMYNIGHKGRTLNHRGDLWAPIMKWPAAIITDHNSRTSHAAIVSYGLGVPVIVGTHAATYVLHPG
ncbi:hypothetical protein BO83DRAFT_389842 [Aspergillus eucalypticola CBS 122712]|uniref:PEP-utilising enzyme mobile domain-containing protein n=1 Tax=Aspergillus eucalypticola (strain CBS 122712 / IBT 29274) TaxID=1448314 RepID=A0A317V9A3_ASPEC|nr:uncharacterized protein BO83DRAFT_389842 [Aspergillus eucalypticola CBS 122712]PWY70635.1 hypothetical protein BO83DRAFT_389842 [Aspergillus eucalypticola CBS 122712]